MRRSTAGLLLPASCADSVFTSDSRRAGVLVRCVRLRVSSSSATHDRRTACHIVVRRPCQFLVVVAALGYHRWLSYSMIVG
jgi:hypothetical protein